MGSPYDLACVLHVHSLHSDGTGTVAEIAAAAARDVVDVVLLTDHDTLAARRAGEEGWHGDVLVLVGEEVSPVNRDHYLAFGIEREVPRRRSAAEICATVGRAGGFGFAAHPFSRASERFSRFPVMPWSDLDCDDLHGIEVWSFVTDSGQALGSILHVLRFLATPGRVLDHPPQRNLAEWDRLCARRRVVGVAGIDAHQIGIRLGSGVPLRLMSYARSFRHLRTHVLCDEPPSGELEHDRDQVYAALRAGRCYMSVDSLARPAGFDFSATGLAMGDEAPFDHQTITATTPRPAALRLLRDGAPVKELEGAELEHEAEEAGVYRLEAHLRTHGRQRTWILSNPIYLR